MEDAAAFFSAKSVPSSTNPNLEGQHPPEPSEKSGFAENAAGKTAAKSDSSSAKSDFAEDEIGERANWYRANALIYPRLWAR